MRSLIVLGLLLSSTQVLCKPHAVPRRSRHRQARGTAAVDLTEVIIAAESGVVLPPPALREGLALVARDETSESTSVNDSASTTSTGTSAGHWSVYETSEWVADPTSIENLAAVAVETVYVTVTAYDGDAITATTTASAASSGVTTASATSSSDSSSTTSSGASSAAITSVATSDTLSQSTNPIDTFVSSSANTSALDLSISLGATITLGLSPSTTVTGAVSTSTSNTVSSSAAASSASSTAATNSSKMVFAHFMVGIVSTYTSSDWVSDMTLAKSKEIDGFALNIGVDSYTQAQLDLAYAAAEQVGFSVFISFDFNWYTTTNVSGVADLLKRYVGQSAQFKVDGKPFVSTFIGDGFDWSSTASQVGQELYAVPFWQPSQANADNSGLSGLFSWAAWPGQLDNVPVNASMDDSRDLSYLSFTGAASKTYMAPVSSWFSTHFGTEVSYSKNWVFKSETLWKDRWDEILSMGSQLNFIEIVTWNDYGESHYIGPYNTPHTDDGSSKWAEGLDHTAMLDFAVPYIKAFKQGLSTPTIEQEMLVYWYRPHLKAAECDSTDNCGSKPTGWDFLSDSIFVATMTTSGGSVTVTSGSNSPVTSSVSAGVQVIEIPMGVGTQSFSFSTTAGGSGSGTSNVTISADCWNGIYNFNYHSGSIVV